MIRCSLVAFCKATANSTHVNKIIRKFIIHVTACNPFVFIGRDSHNQISGSTMTLNSTNPTHYHPSVSQSYCWMLLSPHQHLLPLVSHVTKWPSFALPWSHSPGHWIFNVRKDDGLSSTPKMSTKHSINILGCLINSMCTCTQGGPWKYFKTSRCTQNWILIQSRVLIVVVVVIVIVEENIHSIIQYCILMHSLVQ